MGDAKARELISEAIYLVSIGSNDYLMGYAFDPEMHKSFVIDEYVGMVIGNLTYAIQVSYIFICSSYLVINIICS